MSYRWSYVPEPPEIDGDLSGPRDVGEAHIAWDATNVHVEIGFSVERKSKGGDWEQIGPRYRAIPRTGSQIVEVTLTEQDPGRQTYRVVSKTFAPRQRAFIAASGEISFVVKGPPPNTPTGVVGSGVVNGISLRWDVATDVPPIEGYEYKVNAGAWRPMASSNDDTTRFVARGLSSGVEHSVQIRSVRAKNWSQPSVAVTATPLAPPVFVPPPPIPPPPCDGKTRPADFSIGPVVTTSTQTRWITSFASPPFCVQYEEQQTTTTTTVIRTSYRCDGRCYVATVTQDVSTSTGPWRRTGTSRPCNFPGSNTNNTYTLSAGIYELQLGEQRIRFTVPDDTQVVLAWRETADGASEAVLGSGSNQVVLGSDALSGNEQARSARFASVSEPTLSNIVASLHAPAAGETVVTSSTTTACVEIEAGDNGASAVDLEVNACAMLRYGGAVTVTSDDLSRAFNLAADREWLVVKASLYDAGVSAAATFVDMLSGGYITLSLTDGSELSRHIPDGATDLAALFDAMRTVPPSESSNGG